MKASQLEILPKIEKAKDEKKARILTLILLMISVIPSVAFWLAARLREKKISLPKPSVELKMPQFDLGEKKKDDLAVKLSRWAAEAIVPLPGKWAVRVELLTEDFAWGINDQDQFIAASLIKLPVVAAFYYQVEQGKLSLEESYILKKEDKVAGAGSLQYQPAGTKVTLGQLASLALSQSDNTAFKILRRQIGDQEINRLMTQWGMNKTDLENNLTSAADIALFFRRLYQGETLNQEFSQRMLDDLTGTIFEDRIPAGVPEGIRVAHKVGTETGVISDAGIIFTPGKPFILVILSQDVNEEMAKEKFPQLVNEIYWLVVED